MMDDEKLEWDKIVSAEQAERLIRACVRLRNMIQRQIEDEGLKIPKPIEVAVGRRWALTLKGVFYRRVYLHQSGFCVREFTFPLLRWGRYSISGLGGFNEVVRQNRVNPQAFAKLKKRLEA